MSSKFITSAVSGKKAAPKAPARRRPAPSVPTAPPPTQPAPAAADEPGTVAPPSPPATQLATQTQPRPPQNTTSPPPRDPSSPPRDPTPPAPPQPQRGTSPPQPAHAPTPPVTQREPTASKPTLETEPGRVNTLKNGALSPTPPGQPAAVGLSHAGTRAEVEATSEQLASTTVTQQVSPGRHTPGAEGGTTGEPRKRLRDGAQIERQSDPPAKKQKRSSARSNATVQAAVTVEGPETETTKPTPKAKRSSKIASTAESQERPAVRKKKAAAAKRPRKVKSAATVTNSETPEPGQSEAEEEVAGTTAPKRKPRRKQVSTPSRSMEEVAEEGEVGAESDPEMHEIDPNTLSMWEVTLDDRHGKVSEREKLMDAIDWDEVKRKRNAEFDRIRSGRQDDEPSKDQVEQPKDQTEQTGNADGDVMGSTEGPEGAADDSGTPARPAEEEPAGADEGVDFGTADGVRLRLVNGQIVEDETSLNIAEPSGVDAATDIIIEEENDLTQRHNRTTWLNNRRRDPTERVPIWRMKSDPWSAEETDRFYAALRSWGTDFFIISQMFAPKTRKQVKLKFNREEKLDPVRINNALLGLDDKPAMTLEIYARETGEDIGVYTKYRDLEHADIVIKDSMRDKEEAMEAALREEKEAEQAAVEAKKEKERKKKEGAERRARKVKGQGRMGAGTMGGGGDD